jgi:hypothetical protein
VLPSRTMSAYLNEPNRLGDVIAAIQAMGTYKFYKLDFEGWADRMSADKSRAGHWQRVFEEHPEFFRLDGQKKKASLVWRRQYPRRFHVDSETLLTKQQLDALAENERARRLSRSPLTPADINTLISTAINLHSRALDARKESRWWIPLAAGVGSLIGAIGGALIGAFLGTD